VSCRVVITGLGLLTPLGASPGAFWEQLMGGVSGIGPLTRFPSERFACRRAAQIDDEALPPATGPYAHELKRMDRFVRYAVAAAGGALEQSGIAGHDGGGVFMGVGMGGLPNMEAGVVRQDARGPRKITPYLIPSLIPNMAASMTALTYGLHGPQYTVAGACASGLQAIGVAVAHLRAGMLSWAVAGGTEGVVTPIAFSGFEALRVLSTATNGTPSPRPFDAGAEGMIVGEGAAAFVLEEREHALARGATIHGELTGFATTTGGEQIALQSVAGIVSSMAGALRDAGMARHDIDCLYSHASGVPRGDACELDAVRTVFGGNGRTPTLTSIKGHLGHTFGASGPLNLAAAIAALQHQTVSPVLNLRTPRSECDGFDVASEARPRPLRNVLINAVGFGGINSSLIVSRAS
jgi:3-oxoacyl-[acyl-carrier-protein] synthase II